MHTEKKRVYKRIIYTIVTAILILLVLLLMIKFLYGETKSEAYEMLHMQTKQIKDDLILQIKSDKENLDTMKNLAERLYTDGEDYSRLFESFKPIGLISYIGILNPDNIFITTTDYIDLNNEISFENEVLKGEYISGRTFDFIRKGKEVVRCAVPIEADDEIVGILYGFINIEIINEKYGNMAKNLDAQLFVYDKESEKFIIDTINKKPGKLSDLRNRKYKNDASYDDFMTTTSGFVSFESIFKEENAHLHYSTIDDFNWGIMLARYDSQVFSNTHRITFFVFFCVLLVVLIIFMYMFIILKSQRHEMLFDKKASEIRKFLLNVNEDEKYIKESLKIITDISRARETIFVEDEGQEYSFTDILKNEQYMIRDEDRQYFISELFRYSFEYGNKETLKLATIKADSHLKNANGKLYMLFNRYNINKVVFVSVINNNNNNILAVINPKKQQDAKIFLKKIAVCFSISIYNKNHLKKTDIEAKTDGLTNLLNRTAYKKDLLVFDEEKSSMVSCIYIDVNELHLCNNKYGHAAGDEMLIYIASTLKEIFSDQKVYRLGGDEFLVFVKDTEYESVKENVDMFNQKIKSVGYHVAIGVSYRSHNINTEEMIREAEIRMYEAKSQYYQNKKSNITNKDIAYIQLKTGIREIDLMISVLKEHYNGIYRVSLETGIASRILMPSYLDYNEAEGDFSHLFEKYANQFVDPYYHRAFINFLNYDVIQRHLLEGITPKLEYKKVNGEAVIVSVYALDEKSDIIKDTLWFFEKA